MDYKKIIAATAVTSAAFVVPAVVGAEGTEKAELLGMAENASVSVGQELTVSFKDSEDNAVEFEKFTWSVIDLDNTVKTLPNVTNSYKPTYNLLGKKLQVVAKVKGEEIVYTQTVEIQGVNYINIDGILPDSNSSFFWNDQVTLNPVNAEGVKFKPSKIEWRVNDKYVGDATSLKIPFGAEKVEAILVDPSGTQVFFDRINIATPDKVKFFKALEEPSVNEALAIDLDIEGIIKKVDWYIGEKFYKSGVEASIDIPVIASGKKVNAIVTLETTSNDIKLYSDEITINEVSLPSVGSKAVSKINNKDMDPLNDFIIGNDVISVELPEYEGSLTTDQMNITYEWYGTNDKSSIKIPNATTNSFTVPADTSSLPYRNYIAKITVTVPGTTINEIYYSQTFNYDDNLKARVEALINDIEALQSSLTTYTPELTTTLETVLDSYNSLPPNAQVLVTNSAKLITAQNDLKIATPVIKALNAFKSKYDEMSADQLEQSHKELLKEVTKIQGQFEKLKPLQKSIVNDQEVSGTSFAQIKEYLNKFSADVSEDKSTTMIVANLNIEIEALISDFGTPEGTYNLDRSELKKEIENLNKRIKTVDKKYLPLIKTTIIKNAEADLKKAERAVKKIQAIETAEASKKSKAVNAARIEFNKLSTLQQSLISDGEQKLFILDESDPETKVQDLEDKIDSLISGNAYNFTSAVFDGKTMTQAFEDLVAEYKVLSPADRKLVGNYAIVTQFGKDIKAATSAKKPLLALDKAMVAYYDEVDEKKQASKMKTAYSKYTAAYKAYTKLTPLQQSILTSSDFIEGLTVDFDYEAYFVYGSAKEFEELLSVPEPKEGTNPEKVPSLDKAILVVKSLEGFYNGILAGDYSIEAAKQEIELLKDAYSDLLPAEKKNVYNYSVISTVNSMISKATSAKKKLDSANTEAKLVNAIAAYNKLSDPQQKLIADSFEIADSKLLEILGTKPDYQAIEELIVDLENNYTKDAIKAITDQLAPLSSKELKALKNYKIYTDALKDLKAVDKFESNIQKQGTSPTYSKIEKILKDFNKLTANQVKLLNGYMINDESLLVSIQNWSADMRNRANTLNEKLAGLISLGEYNIAKLEVENSDVQSLELAISKIEADYKALDSKEKKLVTNYGVLKTLKSDLKKVTPILTTIENFDSLTDPQQEETLKKAQTAYQRLSAEQVSLYKQLSDIDLDAVQ